MREIDVFDCVRALLPAEGFSIVQLVPPGGQAPMSLTFEDDERRRTCFPDLIAVREDVLLVGELKPRFSLIDYRKVCTILARAEGALRALVSRHPGACAETPRQKVVGVLCHGDMAAPRVASVHQLAFGHGRAIEIVASDHEGPVIITAS